MKSGFGRKLFRLFLLFSLVPSAVLALLGYYLTTESTAFQTSTTAGGTTELDSYYKTFVVSRIEAGINAFILGAAPLRTDLDFLFTLDDTVMTTHVGDSLLASVGSNDLRTRIFENHSSMLETPYGVLQYHCSISATSELICGGYLHDREYSQMLEQIQREQAERSSSKELRSRYLYFLALLFLLVGCVTVVVAWVFSSRLAGSLSRPLIRLSNASEEIAEGKFGRKIEPAGVGEIRTLIHSFNRCRNAWSSPPPASPRRNASRPGAAWQGDSPMNSRIPCNRS